MRLEELLAYRPICTLPHSNSIVSAKGLIGSKRPFLITVFSSSLSYAVRHSPALGIMK